MASRICMNVPRVLSDRLSTARSSEAAAATEGRAGARKFESTPVRAVRPLAASARPQRFEEGSSLCAEPSFGLEREACLSGHSFLGRTKNPMPIKDLVSLGRVTACSERMQALRWSTKSKTRGGAVRAALPNPSIERDVQGLSPSAAPHVKRWASQEA